MAELPFIVNLFIRAKAVLYLNGIRDDDFDTALDKGIMIMSGMI